MRARVPGSQALLAARRVSVAAVTIVVHLALTLPTRNRTAPKLTRALCRTMAGLPSAAFVMYVLAQAEGAASLGDSLAVDRNDLVCRFADGSPFFFKDGPLVILSVSLAIVIAATLYLFLRIKDILKLGSIRAWRELLRGSTENSNWLALLIRLGLFEIICIASVLVHALDALAPTNTTHLLLVIFGGMVPFLVSLIFGTTTALRSVWCNFIVRMSMWKSSNFYSEDDDKV